MRYISKILKLANNNVTVALSSGPDSLAVAHFIKTKIPQVNLKCFHYNHKLRPQNEEMEQKCKEFCSKFNIDLFVSSRNTEIDDLPEGQDLTYSEDTLRQLRYGAMSKMGYVVTGHHLNDAVENYLMNCFNGYPEYLPMPLVTPWTLDNYNLVVIRPFILNTKRECIEYVSNNDLWDYLVIDDTNSIDEYRRNWLRNRVIPEIEKNYSLETVVRKRILKYLEENY